MSENQDIGKRVLCLMCKRPLKNPRWVKINYGPVCYKKFKHYHDSLYKPLFDLDKKSGAAGQEEKKDKKEQLCKKQTKIKPCKKGKTN